MSDFRFTSTELERLAYALLRLSDVTRGPWDFDLLVKFLPRGGRSTSSIVTQMEELDLLKLNNEGQWEPGVQGARVLQDLRNDDHSSLVYLALATRPDELGNEIERFVLEATDGDGALSLSHARARTVSPNLAAIFSWEASWSHGDQFVVPQELVTAFVEEIVDEPQYERPAWVDAQEEVGFRGELYTLRLLREANGHSSALHISRDSGDQFGYDVEDLSTSPPTCIECKASRGEELQFIISYNELKVARRNPENYVVHFWGGLSLSRSREEEFVYLVSRGYPKEIRNLADQIDAKEIELTPMSWMATVRKPPDSQADSDLGP